MSSDDPGIIRQRRVLKVVAYTSAIALGALLASAKESGFPDGPIESLDDNSIDSDLAYYQGKLHNASGAGCQMSIEEFRRYHGLKDELQARASK